MVCFKKQPRNYPGSGAPNRSCDSRRRPALLRSLTKMDPVNTAAGAFAAGLATSLHCAGMCGPLVCSLGSLKNQQADPQTSAALYHIGRLVSYASLGAIAGSLGRWPLTGITGSPAMVLPWVLVAVLVVMALGGSIKLPRPAFLTKWAIRTRFSLARIPARRGALALGLMTPLLPCGPLYLMLGIALVSGSALRGMEFMLAFTLGTIPLLWLAQHQFGFWQQRMTPATMSRVRRVTALAGALLVLTRMQSLPSASPTQPEDPPTVECLLCHGP